jgi:TonB family protein
MLTSIALLLALQTPAPATCNRDAIVTTQVSPDYPESARELGLGLATVSVRVYLSPRGTIAALRVVDSSGNLDLDQAALRAAAQSTYMPRMKNCKPAFGLYVFKVTFDSNR